MNETIENIRVVGSIRQITHKQYNLCIQKHLLY
jgi:hypothetical protein